MISSVNSFFQSMERYADPRTANLPLMSSPWPLIFVCAIYVTIGKTVNVDLLPDLNLRKPLLIHNFFMISLNFILLAIFVIFCEPWQYNFTCGELTYSDSEFIITQLSYCFFISKLLDFLDTTLLILRKKKDHLSNLHIIHHGLMPIVCWIGAKYFPGSNSWLALCH